MASLANTVVATQLARARALPEFARLQALLKERSYRTGDFVLSSGKRSSFYLDARTTTLCAEGSVCVGKLIWTLIEPLAVDAVGGLTLGADPVVSAVVMASQLSGASKPVDGFLIRKEAKGHGAKRQVEGFGDNTLPNSIILVEDVTTTGLSFDTAMAAVRQDLPEATVVLGVSIVDRRESPENPSIVGDCGIPFQALMRIEELN